MGGGFVQSVLNLLRRASGGARGSLSARNLALYALLIAANVLVWLWAWVLFADQPPLIGAALLAYVYGVRHAVDADHIAAIDNVVRKLMQDGKRPVDTGFFFSLGHSTVVILATAGVAVTASATGDWLQSFRLIGGGIGTAVSAVFLLVIGVVNVSVLMDVLQSFTNLRQGKELVRGALQGPPNRAGLLARLCGPLFRAISSSWQMYPLGFLFGLGFDTATEVGLLGIAASQASNGLSIWSILVFPALFTAGMALVDTADSVLMVEAYGWAFADPVRKLWYNLTITAASAAVALFIGGVEAAGLIADKFALEGQVWQAAAGLNGNLANFGFVVIAMFAASWVISALIYRWKRYGQLAALSD